MEGCPIESPDGRALFFASNRAGGQGGIDIWMARRDGPNEPWRDPVNLPPPVNSASDDFCPTPLVDGELFFVSRRAGGCGEGSADIFYTRLDPTQGWAEPVRLGCDVNSAGDEFAPSYVAASGGTLFFSSSRDGTHKIYASPRRPDGSFGAPVEVTELNAPGFSTLRPNVSDDGLEIVFDSDRPGGLGGPDVWSATRASASDTWRAPVNLGEGRGIAWWLVWVIFIRSSHRLDADIETRGSISEALHLVWCLINGWCFAARDFDPGETRMTSISELDT